MKPLQILLVDDHADALEAIAYYLSLFPDFFVAGKADTGEKAVELVRARPVDLVLMDLFMPTMNGDEATRLIKALPRPPRVVIVTLYSDVESRAGAREAGADGFLGKSEITSRLLPLIQKLFPERKSSWTSP